MLILKHKGTVVQDVENGSRFTLPNGNIVAPAYAGWAQGGYTLEVEPVPAVNPQQQAEDDLAANRAAMRLSFPQLLIGLVSEQWISEADGEAWLTGTLPQAVTQVISSLPLDHRFAAKARALRPSEVTRLDPLVGALAAAEGKSGEDLDAFFLKYGAV